MDEVQRGSAWQLTPMGRARAALALTATPKSLPCREKERAELMRFVDATVTPGAIMSFLRSCIEA